MPRHAETLPVCPYHRIVHLDAERAHTVCSLCWGEGPAITESRLSYPADAVQYLAERGAVVEEMPPHNPDCRSTGVVAADAPEIVYPGPGAVLYLPRDFDGGLQACTLRAAHRRPDSRLFWYLDGSYLGETRGRHTIAPRLGSGTYELLVIDEQGGRARVGFEVLESEG